MSQKSFLLLFLISIALSSCIVIPQTADIPLIKKKNDLRIDAGISLIPSANATVSYGLTDKMAVQTFGSYGADNSRYFQGALGYFKKSGLNNAFEVYGGGGWGSAEAVGSSGYGKLFGSYNMLFTQFNWGRLGCKFANLDYGLSLKAGLLTSELTDDDYYHPADGINTDYSDKSLILQPTVFTRIGGEKLKFSLKLGSCRLYKFTNRDKKLPYSRLNIGLSLNYTIQPKRRNRD